MAMAETSLLEDIIHSLKGQQPKEGTKKGNPTVENKEYDVLGSFVWGLKQIGKKVAEIVAPIVGDTSQPPSKAGIHGKPSKAGMESTLQERPAEETDSIWVPDYIFREHTVDRTRPDEPPQKRLIGIRTFVKVKKKDYLDPARKW